MNTTDTDFIRMKDEDAKSENQDEFPTTEFLPQTKFNNKNSDLAESTMNGVLSTSKAATPR